MPFKSGKSPKDMIKNVGESLHKISGKMSEDTIESLAYQIGDQADYFVPIDTYDLLQSRKIVTIETTDGWTAVIGYYEPYAQYLYDEDKTWQPRQAGANGKRGSGLNLNAESMWIHKGLEQIDVMTFIANKMRL